MTKTHGPAANTVQAKTNDFASFKCSKNEIHEKNEGKLTIFIKKCVFYL